MVQAEESDSHQAQSEANSKRNQDQLFVKLKQVKTENRELRTLLKKNE
jgi:hypothetical protein